MEWTNLLKSKYTENIKCAKNYRCLVLTFIDSFIKTWKKQSAPKTVFSIVVRRLKIPRTFSSNSHGKNISYTAEDLQTLPSLIPPISLVLIKGEEGV